MLLATRSKFVNCTGACLFRHLQIGGFCGTRGVPPPPTELGPLFVTAAKPRKIANRSAYKSRPGSVSFDETPSGYVMAYLMAGGGNEQHATTPNHKKQRSKGNGQAARRLRGCAGVASDCTHHVKQPRTRTLGAFRCLLRTPCISQPSFHHQCRRRCSLRNQSKPEARVVVSRAPVAATPNAEAQGRSLPCCAD